MSSKVHNIEKKEYVILVDEQDHPIGIEEKIRAHENGFLHRAFSVFLFRIRNDILEMLLQQRQYDKYHCGGLWSNACCSHPRPDETLSHAAVRRLKEELNILMDATVFKQLPPFVYRAEFENGLIEHECDHLLLAFYEGPPIVFNPEEVQDVRWVALDVLEAELKVTPKRFTPWFPLALKWIKERSAKI